MILYGWNIKNELSTYKTKKRKLGFYYISLFFQKLVFSTFGYNSKTKCKHLFSTNCPNYWINTNNFLWQFFDPYDTFKHAVSPIDLVGTSCLHTIKLSCKSIRPRITFIVLAMLRVWQNHNLVNLAKLFWESTVHSGDGSAENALWNEGKK